ncbi:hypothetical protein ABVT39_002950 [Epinephelus coioides]
MAGKAETTCLICKFCRLTGGVAISYSATRQHPWKNTALDANDAPNAAEPLDALRRRAATAALWLQSVLSPRLKPLILTTFCGNEFQQVNMNKVYAFLIPTCQLYLSSKRKYYIGQTASKLKIRLNEHRSSIKRADMTSTVARHFCEHGHIVKDLKCIGIEKVVLNRRGGDQEKRLLQRECAWIHKLKTLVPSGMNEDFNMCPM